MINNDFTSITAKVYSYKTHSFNIKQVGDFVGAEFHIDGDIYLDMIMASNGTFMQEFMFFGSPIENERYLIWRFIHNILQEENDSILYFSSENEFKKFCTENHIEYLQQRWFKRVYFKCGIDEATKYCVRNSLTFQEIYFSEDKPYHGTTLFTLHDVQMKARSYHFKDDFLEIHQILKQHCIDRLYHFTDIRNLKSIFDNGAIFSNNLLLNKSINVYYASSDSSRDIDMRAGLGEFVHLSFARNHPMMYNAHNSGRIRRPVIIEIDPTIALMPHALFTDMNALKIGSSRGSSSNFLRAIRFDIVKQKNYFDLNPNEKAYYQAEVMVKDRVGTEMFLNYDELRSLI